MDPGEEISELRGAEHCFGWVGRVTAGWAAVAACVEEEEFCGTLGKGKVGLSFAVRRRVRSSIVVCEGAVGRHGYARHVAAPVVLDLVIVDDVDPGEVVADGRP